VLRDLALALEDLDEHDGWLSSAVVKISERLVGMAVLRSMSLVNGHPWSRCPARAG
jgi:hypothetical protein